MAGKLRAFLWASIAAFGLVALTACGGAEFGGGGVNKASPPGLFTDATLVDYLQTGFEEVKACGDFAAGDYEALTVVIMEPQFPCQWYNSGCSGEFVTPNTIKLGSPYVWKHEVIHYLLYVNGGNADSNHASRLFWDCV
ncbi:MAG: hypothetical protein ACE5FN_09755 [Leptospirillia bacterium]